MLNVLSLDTGRMSTRLWDRVACSFACFGSSRGPMPLTIGTGDASGAHEEAAGVAGEEASLMAVPSSRPRHSMSFEAALEDISRPEGGSAAAVELAAANDSNVPRSNDSGCFGSSLGPGSSADRRTSENRPSLTEAFDANLSLAAIADVNDNDEWNSPLQLREPICVAAAAVAAALRLLPTTLLEAHVEPDLDMPLYALLDCREAEQQALMSTLCHASTQPQDPAAVSFFLGDDSLVHTIFSSSFSSHSDRSRSQQGDTESAFLHAQAAVPKLPATAKAGLAISRVSSAAVLSGADAVHVGPPAAAALPIGSRASLDSYGGGGIYGSLLVKRRQSQDSSRASGSSRPSQGLTAQLHLSSGSSAPSQRLHHHHSSGISVPPQRLPASGRCSSWEDFAHLEHSPPVRHPSADSQGGYWQQNTSSSHLSVVPDNEASAEASPRSSACAHSLPAIATSGHLAPPPPCQAAARLLRKSGSLCRPVHAVTPVITLEQLRQRISLDRQGPGHDYPRQGRRPSSTIPFETVADERDVIQRQISRSLELPRGEEPDMGGLAAEPPLLLRSMSICLIMDT